MELELYDDLLSQGMALMAAENYPAAKDCFEQAIELNPRDKRAYSNMGDAYANLGMYDEAIEAFQKILLLNANDGEALFSIGNVYVLADKKLKAVEFYNKAENAGYTNSQMYQIMASIFFEANDVTQALRNISRAIENEPLNGQLRLYKAQIYLAFNHFDEALENLDEMEKILPDSFETYDMRAQIYCGLQRYDEALSVSQRGIERFPEDVNIVMTRLKVLVIAGKDKDARDLLDKMKENGMYKLAVKDAAIQESILDIKAENYDDAYKALFDANKELDGHPDLVHLLMDLCGKTGKYDKLLIHSEEMINMPCSDFYLATALYFHANALEETGEVEKAKAEYRTLTSRLRKFTINNPAFYEGYLYRLLSHTKIGEFDKALELADYVENLYPDKADAHAFRYFVYKEKGDTELAEKEREITKSMNSEWKL